MEHTPRLFSCARCHAQTVICSDCDRGQIYCGSSCAHEARRQSCRAADKRYQNTFRGKIKHALRQRRYRERLNEKVTDQGSASPPQESLLCQADNKAEEVPIEQPVIPLRCCFCRKEVSVWFRQGFIRYPLAKTRRAWPYSMPP